MTQFKVGQLVTAKFATYNKNNTLWEYRQECDLPEFETTEGLAGTEARNWTQEIKEVEQVIVLDPVEYNQFTNSFLTDRPVIFNNTTHKGCQKCTIVVNGDNDRQAVAIDNSGHAYARYVGINPEILNA